MALGKKILIAEDEKPLSRALSLKLQKAGIEADIASNGDEVTRLILQGGYDLILMDLMMPNHDGFAVMEGMKERNDKTPVVILSNLSQDSDRNRAALAGATHYFVKSDIALGDIVIYVTEALSA